MTVIRSAWGGQTVQLQAGQLINSFDLIIADSEGRVQARIELDRMGLEHLIGGAVVLAAKKPS